MNEDLSAELLERAGRDQAARMSLLRPGLAAAEWAAEFESVVAPVDRDNTARLWEIIARYGWPGQDLAGEAGAHAAWVLVQHAPPDLQEQCLPLLQDAVAQGDASPVDLALHATKKYPRRDSRITCRCSTEYVSSSAIDRVHSSPAWGACLAGRRRLCEPLSGQQGCHTVLPGG